MNLHMVQWARQVSRGEKCSCETKLKLLKTCPIMISIEQKIHYQS